MNYRAFLGTYATMGITLEIIDLQGQLLARMPGVPPGYEIVLEPVMESALWEMKNGPLRGARFAFHTGPEGEVTHISMGEFELAKVTAEEQARLDMPERLLLPEISWTEEKKGAFAALFERIQAQANGQPIDYQLPFPKHEFVQYLIDQDQVIFHGSNNREIAEFAPVRKSTELNDTSGRGNLQAVYGTHDGLWSMFFAVVDRQRLKGSIRNGVNYFDNQAGEKLAVYNFSINQDQLAERPFTAGALYLLPRESFTRLELAPGIPSNEWASEMPVRPLARLDLEPEDFPFLEQIGGHDDGPIVRLNLLSKQVRAAATAANLDAERFVVRLDAESKVVAELEEFQALLGQFMGSMQLEIAHVPEGVQLTFTQIPPAMRQIFKDRYAELL